MPAGRTPKPTALKIKLGNPGGRPLNQNEAKPTATNVRAPAHMSDAAKKEWARLRGKLLAAGLLTDIDVNVLAMYCMAWARWVEAEDQLSRFGMVVKTKNGNLTQNPYLWVANTAMSQMLLYSRELGMTPSSRSRIQVSTPSDAPSLAEELFMAASRMSPE